MLYLRPSVPFDLWRERGAPNHRDQFAEHRLSKLEVVGPNTTTGCMRDNTRASLAFRLGTNNQKLPRPVISMR